MVLAVVVVPIEVAEDVNQLERPEKEKGEGEEMRKSLVVHMERDPGMGYFNVFIFERHGEKLFTARPQEIIMEEVKGYSPRTYNPGKNLKPFLSLDPMYSADLFAEFAEQLAKLGFKSTKDEEDLKSVLKAKDYHLEDMRNLVFKKRR